MKLRNVKQAMENDNIIVKNIYAKGSKTIRVDFAPKFNNNGYKFQSFWINRDYFQRNYPNTYNRF